MMRTRLRKYDFNIVLFTKAVFGGKVITWHIILLFIALMLIAVWLPDSVTLLLHYAIPDNLMPLVKLIISVILFVIVVLYINQAAKQHFPPLEVKTFDNPPSQKALVIFLSTLSNPEGMIEKFKESPCPVRKRKDDVSSAHDAIKRHFKSWGIGPVSWEMPILAISHHYPELEHLYVITSPASDDLYEKFKINIEQIFPDLKGNITPIRKVDFENVEAVFNAVDSIFTNGKHNVKDILVDITSGQKPSSAAAVIPTLSRDRRFQYVGTNDKVVRAYDVEIKED